MFYQNPDHALSMNLIKQSSVSGKICVIVFKNQNGFIITTFWVWIASCIDFFMKIILANRWSMILFCKCPYYIFFSKQQSEEIMC